MTARLNLVGMKFGRLTVLKFNGIDSRAGKQKSRWECVCDCGNKGIYTGSQMKGGTTQSCGCLQRERASESLITHGMCGTTEFYSWTNMKTRCFNKKSQDYEDYGGRGITVCERWKNSFKNFVEDMGLKPAGKYSIDRLNTNGNYELGNCRWGTDEQQARNKRNNRWIECNGLRMILEDWAVYFGVNQGNLSHSIKARGMDRVYAFYLEKHGKLPAP